MALDNADAFPTDPNRMKDSDKDNGTKDSDKDGVSDEEDTFPLNLLETQDLGDSRFGQQWPWLETKDSGDGVGDNDDAIPNNLSFGAHCNCNLWPAIKNCNTVSFSVLLPLQ